MGRPKKDRVGEVYKTREGYNAEIIEYISNFNITIKLSDGTVLYNNAFKEIKNGQIKNPYHKSVCGVGFSGEGVYKVSIGSKVTKCGGAWGKILQRCHAKIAQNKRPTYKDCSVTKEWHNFQNFGKWWEENWKPWMDGTWQVDKDILIRGNRVYSPDNCCIVPQEINTLFIKNNINRGNLPIGVQKERHKYRACMRGYIGTFDTIQEAFQAYKTAKEAYIKEVADKYRGQITEKVYQAMYNYQVEITD